MNKLQIPNSFKTAKATQITVPSDFWPIISSLLKWRVELTDLLGPMWFKMLLPCYSITVRIMSRRVRNKIAENKIVHP